MPQSFYKVGPTNRMAISPSLFPFHISPPISLPNCDYDIVYHNIPSRRLSYPSPPPLAGYDFKFSSDMAYHKTLHRYHISPHPPTITILFHPLIVIFLLSNNCNSPSPVDSDIEFGDRIVKVPAPQNPF